MKRSTKKYGSTDKRRQIERLLTDEEIYSPEELKEKRRRTATAMRMIDYDLIKEEEATRKAGHCRFCYLVLTTEGKCPAECN